MRVNRNILGPFLAVSGILISISGAVPVITSGNPLAVSVIFFFSGLAIVIVAIFVFFSQAFYDFLTSWMDGESYQIINPRDEEIEAVYRFAQAMFGDEVTPESVIKKITSKYKSGLKVAKRKTDEGEFVVGYIFYFPINKSVVDRIIRYEFSAKDLCESDVCKNERYGYAYYVGAVAAKGFRAKAQMLGALKSHEDLVRLTKTKTIYAKAASDDGLRIIKKSGFVPVHAMADGTGCFFKKTLN